MNDIIKEAEEDLQKERLLNFWNQYKFFIIAALSALILGTAAVSLYQDWALNRDHAATAKIRASLVGIAPVSLDALEKLDQELPKKHRAIADMLAADKAVGGDDKATTIKNLQAVIDNNVADPLLRDMARVNLASVYLSIKDTEFKKIETTLLPVLKDRKNAFYVQALLYFSVAQANKAQDYEQALVSLDKIKNAEQSSSTINELARILTLVYQNEQEKAAK
ncbi:MAG: hypothetical protein CMH30_03545 [Micavibrio sp.]|nr:hypothetical protein [Micavibrio sp.]